jgi:hypothetical protein
VPTGQLDLFRLGQEQGRDRCVEGQGQGGQFGRGEGAASALGLVDGLAAPRFAQVTPYGLAQLGERQLAGLPKVGNLLANGHLDRHAARLCHPP